MKKKEFKIRDWVYFSKLGGGYGQVTRIIFSRAELNGLAGGYHVRPVQWPNGVMYCRSTEIRHITRKEIGPLLKQLL